LPRKELYTSKDIYTEIGVTRQMFAYLVCNKQSWCGFEIPEPTVKPCRGRDTMYSREDAQKFIDDIKKFYEDHIHIEEVTTRLNVSSRTVWAAIERGTIYGSKFCAPVGKYNGRWWWKRSELDDCVKAIKSKQDEMSG